MAASPVGIVPASSPTSNPTSDPTWPHRKRRPFTLTARRLAANRRNAARSTGPRTTAGKARAARNSIKHGFFVEPQRWSPTQHRDFIRTLDGLRADFEPQSGYEAGLVAAMADSYVRMAALLRYENLAALKYHQQTERELNERIAAADADEAARLTAHREELRAAGLWRPTLPAPGEAMAILRYEGRLHRTIWAAAEGLEASRRLSIGAAAFVPRNAKTNPLGASASSGPEALRRTSNGTFAEEQSAKTNPLSNSPEAPRATPNVESAKTNPLTMFIGNRHQRRRAEAMARRAR